MAGKSRWPINAAHAFGYKWKRVENFKNGACFNVIGAYLII
ncbi:hypothetical protein SAMN05660816_01895 [Niastella yeongjuensis]|nr:hypothetical protein SAMN05660816_01895 [Niastella yeongjuensis]